MKKYSMLIIGFRCYGGHIREFVTNLKKKNPQVKITVAITVDSKDNMDEIIPCVDKIIQYERRRSGRMESLSKGLYFYVQFIKLWLKGGFDIVDIHFANSAILPFLPLLRLMTKNIIITPWGSDVLRVDDEKGKKVLKKIYKNAEFVTTDRDSIIGRCLVSKFDVSPDKMVKLNWGGEFFDYIQDNPDNITTDDAKERFGLKGKYVITCGYNTQKEQQHEDIIDAIFSIKTQLPENLTLLFPFTYGRSETADKYITTVQNKCDDLDLRYLSVTEHLNMSDLLKLRMATDIFVHVQTTDAGSRCVAEYVLCNKKLVHGAWIKYPYLEDNKPSCYFPVENMEQLGESILKAYQTPIGELSETVKEILLERGWNKKMTLWNNFFESLVD